MLTPRVWLAPGAKVTTSSITFAVSMHSMRCQPSSAMSLNAAARSIHGFQITAEREPLLVSSMRRSQAGSTMLSCRRGIRGRCDRSRR